MTTSSNAVSMVCILADADPIQDPPTKGNLEKILLKKTDFLPKEQFLCVENERIVRRLREVFESRWSDNGPFHFLCKFYAAISKAEYFVVVRGDLGAADGFAMVRDNGGHEWFIDYVMVDPNAIKRGIPEAIFRCIREEAEKPQHGGLISELRLACSEGLVERYRQLGFKKETAVSA